jgi:hypothetical protein
MKYFVLSFLLILIGCAGETPTEVDPNPPSQPSMIPHLGNTGDLVYDDLGNIVDTLNFHSPAVSDYELNGIDAVPQGDWIKIQWYPITDLNIDRIEVYRFSYEDYNAYHNTSEDYPTKISTLNNPNVTMYIDHSVQPYVGTDTEWFYFIKVINSYENWAKSDTVGFKLVNKPILESPADNVQVASMQDITFSWLEDQTQAIQSWRLLLFDANFNLVWMYPILGAELEAEYDGEELSSGVYFWRIDAFGMAPGDPPVEYDLDGAIIPVHTGSKSYERTIIIEK